MTFFLLLPEIPEKKIKINQESKSMCKKKMEIFQN